MSFSGTSSETKGKSPEASEGEEETFYCLAVGFFSSFPLAGVFIESRCYMNAPVKYHMHTLREPLGSEFTDETLVCEFRLPPPSPHTPPDSRPFGIPIPSVRTERYTSSKRLSFPEPSIMGSINFY